MTEFVRVKGSDGSEFTTSEKAAAVFGATVIEGKRAVDDNGRPLVAKSVTDLAGEAVTSTPSKSWRLGDLEKHATDNGIEFAEGSTKADILAAIAAADHTQES